MKIEKKANMKETISQTKLSTKDLRSKVYSCVFCEFIQDNTCDDEFDHEGKFTDRALEAKYLYHLNTVHGLGK
jgi:hypothetical protein